MNTNEPELQKSTSYLPGEERANNEHPEPQDVASEDANKPVSIMSICHEKLNLITARVQRMTGNYVFTGVCLFWCVCVEGGATPSPSHNTSNHWAHALSGGVPHSQAGGGTPVRGRAYPCPGVFPDQGRASVPPYSG